MPGAGALLTPVQQLAAGDELRSLSGTESDDRSSLSAVDDDATTSRLELFQISALNDSCGDVVLLAPNSSAAESVAIATGNQCSDGQHLGNLG